MILFQSPSKCSAQGRSFTANAGTKVAVLLKEGLSLQTQESSLQFCPRQVFHCKRTNQGCSCAQGRSSTAKAGTKVAVLLKAGLPLQRQEPRLQFCPRQVFNCKRRNQVAVLPKAGLPLQRQEPRLQFCPMQVFHCKRRNQGCSSAQGRSSTANAGTKVAVLPRTGL